MVSTWIMNLRLFLVHLIIHGWIQTILHALRERVIQLKSNHYGLLRSNFFQSMNLLNAGKHFIRLYQIQLRNILLCKNNERYLADLLIAKTGVPAKESKQDKSIRPNQLFAITLGAISQNSLANDILTTTEKASSAGSN